MYNLQICFSAWKAAGLTAAIRAIDQSQFIPDRVALPHRRIYWPLRHARSDCNLYIRMRIHEHTSTVLACLLQADT